MEHMDSSGSNGMLIERLKLIIAFLSMAFVVVRAILMPWYELSEWIVVVLATIVQFWAASDFYVWAFKALKKGSFNMYTLIVMGTSTAYFYSMVVFFFGASLKAAGIEPHSYFDASLFVIGFILLGDFFEARAMRRASMAMKALMNLQPHVALVQKKGTNEWIDRDIDQIVVDDIVRVMPGAKIPIDGVIIRGDSTIDESLVTGESIPVAKKIEDSVTGATINLTGTIDIRVTKVGTQTFLAQIIALVAQAQESQPKIQKVVDKIASIFVPVVILCSFITFIVWYFFGPPPQFLHALIGMISVLIVACPCAMGLATPLSIMIAVGLAALKGVLVKDANALEQMRRVDCIVFDKTGTLTFGKQVIKEMSFVENSIARLKIEDWPQVPKMAENEQVLFLGMLLEEQSSHPFSKAYRVYAKEHILFQFNEMKKPLISEAHAVKGLGFEGKLAGHSLLIGTFDIMNEAGVEIPETVRSAVDSWFQLGHSVSFFSIDNELVSYFSFTDELRPEAKRAIEIIKSYGINTILLTGDNEKVAQVVSQELGIGHFFAQVLPEQKSQYIEKLKKQGNIVAMVGDGINDAPALAEAHVGIAIGSGTDVALETAKIVLPSNNLMLIPFTITLSRATMRNIYQNLVWAFGYNMILVPVAMGILYPFFGITMHPVFAGGAMVLSSLSVVLNSLRLKRVSRGSGHEK